MSGKNNSVPRGWLDYTNLGRRIPGTPFVPFKVPLRQAICRNIPDDQQWFMPKDLLEQLPNLKLIINLTNAKNGRYYVFHEFESKGVKVIQIMCEGHGKLPPGHKLEIFFQAVDDFLRQGEGPLADDVIGVHCTHGLNRTGFFICKYLIEKMDMKPDAAIELFEVARGHPIERDHYTNNLRGVHTRNESEVKVANGSESKYSSGYSSKSYKPYKQREQQREEVTNWRVRDTQDDSSRDYHSRRQSSRDNDYNESRDFRDTRYYRNRGGNSGNYSNRSQQSDYNFGSGYDQTRTGRYEQNQNSRYARYGGGSRNRDWNKDQEQSFGRSYDDYVQESRDDRNRNQDRKYDDRSGSSRNDYNRQRKY